LIGALASLTVLVVFDVASGATIHRQGPIESYEAAPGSIVKLVIATAAAEAGKADSSLPRALATSDNPYFKRLERTLGEPAIGRVARRLGVPYGTDWTRLRVRAPALVELLRQLALAGSADVREGMRECGEYGTCRVPGARVEVAGKTGTDLTTREGLQGWFVGWAPADRPRVGVVVGLRGGRGSSAARVGTAALERYLLPPVRVQLADRIAPISLEDYVAGVVEAEARDAPLEARKALAVLARTFALRERGRHGTADVCAKTHCQAYREPSAAARRAADDTRLEVLTSGDTLAPAHYFSTCGGHTAGSATIWPELRPPLPDVDDREHCRASPHLRWQVTLDGPRLEEALGVRPTSIAIEAGPGGWVARARVQHAGGERVFGGEELHLLVARKVGWAAFKSARFTVDAVGPRFVFRGTGMGHGVGLCQWGARGRAEGGAAYADILAAYFPGFSLTHARP